MKRKFRPRMLIVSRVFITAFFLLIQIVWCFLNILRLAEFSSEADYALRLLSIAIAVYLVCKDECPSYKISWIILVLIAPVFGGLLYAVVGNKKPTKKMHRRITETRKNILPVLECREDMSDCVAKKDRRVSAVFEYVRRSSGYPVFGGSEVKYYSMGDDMYVDMISELEKAEKFIFIEYFIIAEGQVWNRIFDILCKKADKGVEVRIIYDDMGCVALLPAGFYKMMEKANPNIKCLSFNRVVPVLSLAMNSRDHRKMMIIDGVTAFSGGINLADEYTNLISPYGVWKDTGFMVRGEGASGYTEMFLEIWESFRKSDNADISGYFPPVKKYPVKGYIQPFYDTPLDDEALGENVYIDILNCAERYAYIFTPYLILDDMMKSALCLAAKRGVDVRIVTPGIPDKKVIYRLTRANYKPLLQAGVRIYEYTPGFIHAKSIISDDRVGMVGTINLDYRSLYLHFECGMLMYGCEALDALHDDAVKTLSECREISLDNLKKYYRGNMFDGLLRMLAPLL